MNQRSSSSSLSSDDESGEEAQNMEQLADLLWHKIKPKKLKKKNVEVQMPQNAEVADSVSSESEEKEVKEASQPSSTQESRLSDMKETEPDYSWFHFPSSPVKLSISNAKKSNGEKNKKTVQPSIYQGVAEKALKDVKSTVEPYKSERQKKKEAKIEKSKWQWGKGKWSSMRMPEMTEDDKNDLLVLSMRSTIDPKRHYKHNDLKMPKFYQIGTMQDDPYSRDRIPKKKRKRTMVDELMADEEFTKKVHRQYQDIKAIKSNKKAIFQGRAPKKIKKRRK